eukprot:scaffold1589_cov111-Isochrysis_galbana.AAC.3
MAAAVPRLLECGHLETHALRQQLIHRGLRALKVAKTCQSVDMLHQRLRRPFAKAAWWRAGRREGPAAPATHRWRDVAL